MHQNTIFSSKLIDTVIKKFKLSSIHSEKSDKILNNWIKAIESPAFRRAKEISMNGDFLTDFFCNVLGYKRQIESHKKWNLSHEQKSKTDSTRADGALGFFSKEFEDIRVVIELKGISTKLDDKQLRKNDKRTPVEQAFSYAHKSGKKCSWVILSNFNELRLYHSNSSAEYEKFLLKDLKDENTLKKFYFLLSNENLISELKESPVEKLYKANEEQQEKITEAFYLSYNKQRVSLFEHLKKNNPIFDEIILLEKAQKLLDRFIFICFCEDTYLLPNNIFRQVVNSATESYSLVDNKIWNELKNLFKAIDKGYPNKNINAFNGGLFAEDEILDSLSIKDDVFEELTNLTDYDFGSELSVNILGHIFEQSVSDIEDIKAKIRGEKVVPQKGKRQTNAIYYTPEHITHYIVENTIKLWLNQRKKEIGIDDLPELSKKDFDSIYTTKRKDLLKYNKKIGQHIDFWEKYKDILAKIKVLDPSCGSGAFLNKAFDVLYNEGIEVINTLAEFRLGQKELFDLDEQILSNNLFGVDINEESVQITKLSLWLKTANKNSPLTALDMNIQCGNSLINDPSIDENKAFCWSKAFPDIMKNGGFDVVLGNPPYEVLSVKETGIKDLDKIIEYFKQDDILKHSIKGKTNLYKAFICKALSLSNENGFFSFIVPMALLGDIQATTVRRYLFENSSFKFIECFPQKDDPNNRVFKDAKLSTVIFGVSKELNDNTFNVRSHPGKYIINTEEHSLNVSKDDIYKFDSVNLIIPTCTNEDWKIVKKIINQNFFIQMSDIAKQYQGEVNETVEGKKGTLVENSSYPEILRGANITMYAVRDASQGKVYYIDDLKFLTGKDPDSKAFHHNYSRIGFQRSSPQNNFRRIIAAPIKPGYYCFDTVSYITKESSKIDLDILLLYLNSNFVDWFFRLTSTNSKVNEYQFNNLPYFSVVKSEFSDLKNLLKKSQYTEVIIKLREVTCKSNIIPSWINIVLKHISKEIQKYEKKRKLKNRKERSKLGSDSSKLQRYADLIFYSIFGLEEIEYNHIEKRLKEML